MSGGKQPAQTKPTALGAMVQASTYGQVIPVIYGRTKTPLYVIYAANLQQEAASGKMAKSSKKGGVELYSLATDFLIGANPISAVYAVWFDQYGRIGTDGTAGIPPGVQTFDISGGDYEITITDPNFAGIVNAVTLHVAIDVTVNDYGSSGPVELVNPDDQQLLFNSWFIGPDPTNPWVAQKWPYVFLWNPLMGPTIKFPANEGGFPPGLQGTVTVYYSVEGAQFQNGLAHYRLTYEPELGDGGGSGQPILYPMYAGVGSPDLDCGAGAVIPGIKLEVQGKFPLWPIGDADFVDMIKDVVMSGQVQQAYSSPDVYGELQHGANCYDYPGIIEEKYFGSVDPRANSFTFDHPITKGTLLVVFMSAGTGTLDPGISDEAGNDWTTVYAGENPDGDLAYGCWYTFSKACAAGNKVTASLKPYNNQISGFAIIGVDSFDAAAIITSDDASDPNDVSLTTTNPGGQASYVMAFVQASSGEPSYGIPDATNWYPVLPNEPVDYFSTVLRRGLSRFPSTVKLNGVSAGGSWVSILVAFKQATPQSICMALGDIIDKPSIELTRNQCHANELWGSLSMTSQKTASDWLKLFCQCANAAPVWSGFKLKVIPYSEVSALRWGIVYYAPTSGGPIANLDVDKGDFLSQPGEAPISVERTAQTDAPNIYQATIYPRIPNYDQTNISQPISGASFLYGPRKADPLTLDCVVDPSVGRKLLMIAARRATLDRNTYKFKLDARYGMLEPMDPVTITDIKAGIIQVPVRFTSLEEQDDLALECEASLFIYGENAPDDLTGSSGDPYQPPFLQDPGSINTPIIFQPVLRLLDKQNQPQLWFVVSGEGQYYGGNVPYVSTDGGESYNQLGVIRGNAATGYTTADWPAAADPDSSNNLPVDLTESNGALQAYSTTDENNFVYPFYVSGGGDFIGWYVDSDEVAAVGGVWVDGTEVVSALSAVWVDDDEVAQYGIDPYIPYELGSYAQVNMTASHKYTIEAQGGEPIPTYVDSDLVANVGLVWVDSDQVTSDDLTAFYVNGDEVVASSGTNYIRRAAFGAPFLGEGVDHPSGSRFCMLDPLGRGMLKIDLDPRWIGQLLYFKFCAFNTTGAQVQSLTDATPYSYEPITQGQSPNYTQTPALALSQPSGVYTVEMAQVTEEFSTNPANYNARSFPIPDPGGTPTLYYVTIEDPRMVGDTGGGTNLTAYCETSSERVGVAGFTYIGAIQVTHAGGAVTVYPGGWPQTVP